MSEQFFTTTKANALLKVGAASFALLLDFLGIKRKEIHRSSGGRPVQGISSSQLKVMRSVVSEYRKKASTYANKKGGLSWEVFLKQKDKDRLCKHILREEKTFGKNTKGEQKQMGDAITKDMPGSMGITNQVDQIKHDIDVMVSYVLEHERVRIEAISSLQKQNASLLYTEKTMLRTNKELLNQREAVQAELDIERERKKKNIDRSGQVTALEEELTKSQRVIEALKNDVAKIADVLKEEQRKAVILKENNDGLEKRLLLVGNSHDNLAHKVKLLEKEVEAEKANTAAVELRFVEYKKIDFIQFAIDLQELFGITDLGPLFRVICSLKKA